MSVFPAKSRFRRRHGRCYELALKTLLDLNRAGNAAGIVLVHGTVRMARRERGGEAID